jgi:hypothetical protein
MAQNKFNEEDRIGVGITGQIIPVAGSGASFIRNADGSLEYFTAEIRTVGIKDIMDVVEHRINTIVGSRLHMVRFVNGGVLTYAYNDAGVLIELASSDLSVDISTNNEVVYYVEREPLAPSLTKNDNPP